MPCFYIPSLYPFFAQSLPVTHTPLTLPIHVHTLHSLSILLIYPPLYHPTLQPLDSPYFKIPSLHSHSSLPLYTPLISSSLPSASTPFSTISTAQSPLGSPPVTRQPPYMTNPPLPLHFYSSTSLHYTPSLPHLYTLSTFTLHMAHPPLTLPLFTPSLYILL